MKQKQWLAILVVIALTMLAALSRQPEPAARGDVSVAVVPQPGLIILSENPVTIPRGETASFQVQIEEGYLYGDTNAGVFQDGVLTLSDVQADRNIYLSLRKRCGISVSAEGCGTVRLLTGDTAFQGDPVTIQVTPEPHYTTGTVEVNGTVYPAFSGDTFTFTVAEDSQVLVRFLGEPLDFLTVSNNLGYIRTENSTDTFRYGDTLTLRCEYDSAHVVFQGWSVAGYLADGGHPVSDEAELQYTLTEDTVLYANFSDRSIYRLTYDGNGCELVEDVEEDHGAGEYVNLALYSDNFRRDGHTLMGFSTSPEGGDLMAPGAMFVMPRQDVTLYAQWAAQTNPAMLDYAVKDGTIVIRGLSEAGRAAGLTTLVIPPEIAGKPVTEIADDAFAGCVTLETVVLPVGLVKLNYRCFAQCESLTTVYFPETLDEIHSLAFSGSVNFTNMRVIGSFPRAFDYDYDSSLVDKYMRLHTTEGKRIILVGGSNLAFGINSAMIEEQFTGYTVINMGVSVHYGMRPLFDLLRANAHEGDIIIFCPEYDYAAYAARETEAVTNWLYLESNYDILKDLNLQSNPVLLERFGTYLYMKGEYLPGKKISTNPVYARSAFDQYGDLIAHRNPGNVSGFTVPETTLITDEGMTLYNEACRELTELGALCCFSFPTNPCGIATESEKDAKLAEFKALLEAGLDGKYITIISDMSDYFFPGPLFYDSMYHMTLEGAVVRTEQLISDLKAFMEDHT